MVCRGETVQEAEPGIATLPWPQSRVGRMVGTLTTSVKTDRLRSG
jgi:hypothetical protein